MIGAPKPLGISREEQLPIGMAYDSAAAALEESIKAYGSPTVSPESRSPVRTGRVAALLAQPSPSRSGDRGSPSTPGGHRASASRSDRRTPSPWSHRVRRAGEGLPHSEPFNGIDSSAVEQGWGGEAVSSADGRTEAAANFDAYGSRRRSPTRSGSNSRRLNRGPSRSRTSERASVSIAGYVQRGGRHCAAGSVAAPVMAAAPAPRSGSSFSSARQATRLLPVPSGGDGVDVTLSHESRGSVGGTWASVGPPPADEASRGAVLELLSTLRAQVRREVPMCRCHCVPCMPAYPPLSQADAAALAEGIANVEAVAQASFRGSAAAAASRDALMHCAAVETAAVTAAAALAAGSVHAVGGAVARLRRSELEAREAEAARERSLAAAAAAAAAAEAEAEAARAAEAVRAAQAEIARAAAIAEAARVLEAVRAEQLAQAATEAAHRDAASAAARAVDAAAATAAASAATAAAASAAAADEDPAPMQPSAGRGGAPGVAAAPARPESTLEEARRLVRHVEDTQSLMVAKLGLQPTKRERGVCRVWRRSASLSVRACLPACVRCSDVARPRRPAAQHTRRPRRQGHLAGCEAGAGSQ